MHTLFRVIVALGMISTSVKAVETEEIELSLQDLMDLKISVGTLTGMTRDKIPVSLTTITADDIALTPARNINDLIEVYVPGALGSSNIEGDHFGLRGVMVTRNYSFLMLVNGFEMGQRGHSGAVTEIGNWDLNDIEQIEVIRGPGSVTYGPGAIQGVVNIVTKSAGKNGSLRVGTAGNPQYRSAGGYASYGLQKNDLEIFSYGSLVRTMGYENPKVFVASDSVYGYVGAGGSWEQKARELKDSRVSASKIANSYAGPSSAYFSDFHGLPQGKLMTDVKFRDLRLQARYTNSGNTQVLGVSNAITRSEGETVDNPQVLARQYLLASEYSHEFIPAWKQIAKISWNDQDYGRWVNKDSTGKDLLRNYTNRFSEKHLKFHTLSQISPTEKLRFAFGGEYSRNTIAAPWFEGSEHLRIGDRQQMFGGTKVSGDSATDALRGIYSPSTAYRQARRAANRTMPFAPEGMVYDSLAVFLGEGWSTNSYGILGEANLEFHKLATLLISGRADKDDHSNWGISPRVALISELTENQVLKLIWQRSVRVNNMDAAYIENLSGNLTPPEVLTGWEAIHNWQALENLSIQSSGYYNNLELLSFNFPARKVMKQGDLQLGGLEFEAKYVHPKYTIGFNESFTHMIGFKLSNDTLVRGSGVSYAENRLPVKSPSGSTVIFNGNGDNINNWSNNATKIYVNWRPLERLAFHLDARAFWEFAGAKDGLDGLEKTVNSLDVGSLPANGVPVTKADSLAVRKAREKQTSLDAIEAIRAQDAYEADIRVNASVAWRFLPWASATVYCQNLIGTGGNKRYLIDVGNDTFYPARFSWIEEPRTFGFRLDATIPGT